MDKRRIIKISAVILIVAVAVGLLVAQVMRKPVAQLEDAKTVYMNAADAARDIHDFVLTVTKNHQITTPNQTYTETADTSISCQRLGSDEMKVSKEETLTVGRHNTAFSQVYAGESLYTVINDGYFVSQVAKEDYEKTLVPIVLLDYNLYRSFSGVDSGEEYVIYLSDAVAPEQWTSSEEIAFVKASGTAYVSYEGMLTKSIYILEYQVGNVSHRVTYAAQMTDRSPSVSIPESTRGYTAIQYIEGLNMLERASGLLTQAGNIQAVSKESTFFEAFGDTRTKTVVLETNNDIDWIASVETETTLSNKSRPDQDSVYKQTETFQLGVYEVEMTGIPAAQNPEITEEEMQNYCQNILVSTIMLPNDIVQCQAEENNGIIRITYTASKEFAQQISRNACDTLYQNPDLLADISQADIVDEMIGYLELDALTGLPVASGLSYNCTYTAEGIPYQFLYEANQTYQIAY